ncbi:MAG TPA: hypothetical protein VFI47_04655 [Acidimicrobiales bacterium]|nr:hypothetical protein [Acidimicrobiales bacterium]
MSPDSPVPGRRIIAAALWGTAVFTVVSLAAAALPDPLAVVSVPVDLVLFAAGCGAFLWAYAVAIGRSRFDQVTMAGVFLLAGGAAPARAARPLRSAFAVQVVVGVAVAAVRPFTALAFAVLAPMFGLGCMALWGARHGTFPPLTGDGDGTGEARAERGASGARGDGSGDGSGDGAGGVAG